MRELVLSFCVLSVACSSPANDAASSTPINVQLPFCSALYHPLDQGSILDAGAAVDARPATDLGNDPTDLGSDPIDLGSDPIGGSCYFTSYPVGSKHCVVGPCTFTGPTPACTTPGYVNYASGTTIFGTYANGQTVAIYPDAATSFPACTGGAALHGEPSDPGDFYATGLRVGATTAQQLAFFCSSVAP